MKRLLFFVLILTTRFTSNGQCLIPGTLGDTLMPVINNFNVLWEFGNAFVGAGSAQVYKIVKSEGRYFISGDFTHLNTNHGPALILDSLTHTIKTPQKWKFNSQILTAIPDGQGGFYVGGNFTRIGDSVRMYLAQINSAGQPTAWNPQADSTVKKILRRNDTLFLGGDFRHMKGEGT